MKTYCYIDAANLNRGAKDLGVEIDYKKMYGWLRQKYQTDKIYLFIGLVPQYTKLYEYLGECGYILVFKETLRNKEGEVKGNCDAELVLKAVSNHYEQAVDQFVLVSGDGDFRCLVDFLQEKDRQVILAVPDRKKCSILLKRTNAPMAYLQDHYHKFKV